MMDLKGKNIIVLGGGESGVGAALLAQKKGAQVFLSDKGKIQDNFKQELIAAAIDFEEGQHSIERIFAADEVIKSPGIPDTVPMIQELRQKGMSVIGEIEFAARYTTAKVLAITGSNGKTTTVYLIHHLLCHAGFNAKLVGNVGFSFARSIANEEAAQVYVIELSSFQLDNIVNFRADLAAILNITPDHLDRYNYEMDAYADSKMRVSLNQRPQDGFWYLKEDTETQKVLQRTPMKAALHTVSKSNIEGASIRVGETLFDLANTRLRGKHNALNALFACQMLKTLEVSDADLQAGLNSFESVPHRLESVTNINGVEYINDSKATNVDAVFYALDAMKKDIVWIAGGIDKGNDYSILMPLVKTKVKAMVCLGADNSKLIAAFGQMIDNIVETDNVDDALAAASAKAKAGQVVLLSPACSSFDLFDNYAARGDIFRAAVLGLAEKNN